MDQKVAEIYYLYQKKKKNRIAQITWKGGPKGKKENREVKQ